MQVSRTRLRTLIVNTNEYTNVCIYVDIYIYIHSDPVVRNHSDCVLSRWHLIFSPRIRDTGGMSHAAPICTQVILRFGELLEPGREADMVDGDLLRCLGARQDELSRLDLPIGSELKCPTIANPIKRQKPYYLAHSGTNWSQQCRRKAVRLDRSCRAFSKPISVRQATIRAWFSGGISSRSLALGTRVRWYRDD